MKILYTDEMNCCLSYEFFTLVAESVFNELDMSSNEYEISLLITDDETIRKYNKEYRNKDRATDVLSFPMEDDIILGDVAISFETAKRQSEEAEINIDREVAFLFIHGLLHLLGYDHETSQEDEEEMFALQEKILKKLVDYGTVS
ncbi:rRNA maturation RNase YbeY [Mucispirillum schaedleri]|jgi:probable rRNA maturation factor|uniref:Endoribonuclease YbeY n=1 Tax=Mucispirillum schaedleri ASF457 TaxID=1379858 RepID=V2QDW4_9BACT|nr:rRNA maturation RNase YbeY [Mucispirillum schaedleri]MCX4360241.1 rRNA maturation RNase YbeY [Mucispirillum schaedleri]USF23091.1 Endoribonuclease YbeY [Mucispirillum schaedleri ASF457]SIW04749.1 Endoribonuclease YbeY [Mucispirillum schaedleri ASF457]